MNKYLIVGIAAFSLMATTVYALNSNENSKIVNESTPYNQNCPYHNSNEDCPYHSNTTSSYDCPNCESGNYYHHNNGNGNHYGRHGRHLHHN